MKRLVLTVALLGSLAVLYRLKTEKPVETLSGDLNLEDLDTMTTKQLINLILKKGPGKLSSRAAEIMMIRYVTGDIKFGDLDYRGKWQDDDMEWAK